MNIEPLSWCDFDTSIFNTLHSEMERTCLRLLVETKGVSLFKAKIKEKDSECIFITSIETNIDGSKVYVFNYAEGKNVTPIILEIEKNAKKSGIKHFRFHSPHDSAIAYGKIIGYEFSEYVLTKDIE